MTDESSNLTLNSSKLDPCPYGPEEQAIHSLISLLTVLLGQPVISLLLWAATTAKKTPDVLNLNLALFHTLHYLMILLDVFVLFLRPQIERQVIMFLFVYLQIGAPMNLTFVCIERYVAVIHPTKYPLLKKYRFREICAISVWLISVPTAMGNVFDVPNLELVPPGVMVVLASMIVRFSVSIARGLKKSGPGKEGLHPAKRRALKTISATSTITLCCFVAVSTIQRMYGLKLDANLCLLTPVCISILSAASLVHPLFYLSAQRKLFTCLKIQCVTSE